MLEDVVAHQVVEALRPQTGGPSRRTCGWPARSRCRRSRSADPLDPRQTPQKCVLRGDVEQARRRALEEIRLAFEKSQRRRWRSRAPQRGHLALLRPRCGRKREKVGRSRGTRPACLGAGRFASCRAMRGDAHRASALKSARLSGGPRPHRARRRSVGRGRSGVWDAIITRRTGRRSALSRKIMPSRPPFESTMEQRLLVISPIRNEAAISTGVARSLGRPDPAPGPVAARRRPLDRRHLRAGGATRRRSSPSSGRSGPPTTRRSLDGRDRLASAAAPRTFNLASPRCDLREFTHISKLDGDMELPPDYFERILGDVRRGLLVWAWREGCGRELVRGRWWVEQVPTGASRQRRAQVLLAGAASKRSAGVQERLGWDTIDETLARMRGFRTRTFEDLVAIHHRPWASADGTLRGRARYGAAAYIVHFPAYWVALRSLKLAATPDRRASPAWPSSTAIFAPRCDGPRSSKTVSSGMRSAERRAVGSPASSAAPRVLRRAAHGAARG